MLETYHPFVKNPLRPPKWRMDPPRGVAAASPKAVRSVWYPNMMADVQPLRWRPETEVNTWASSEANMARHARRARQWARETVIALVEVDVGELGSHSLAPHLVRQSGCRNHVMVDDVGSSQDRPSSISRPPTVLASDEEG